MQNKVSFRDRMLAALEQTGMSVAELARRSGVSYDAINKLKRRENASTSAENAHAIADALGMPLEATLDHARDQHPPSHPNQTLIPVYDVEASAGNGSVVDGESVAHSLAFPPGYLQYLTRSHPRHLAIIGVKGDSMHPTLADDDIVMLDTSKTSLSFDGLFVLRFDDALHVKRISRSARKGHVLIVSDNSTIYPPMDYATDDITVLGKVIWYGKKV